ncbi:MAG: universal stress protein [Deltaproteobacteria bacterium]|nr:universal stress protein [Deltaproteobacteria bacterium]
MLKRILVPLDSSEYSSAAVKLAVQISKTSSAKGPQATTIVGLGVVDLDQIPTGRFADIIDREKLISEAEATAEELMNDFTRKASALGVDEKHLETRKVVGSPFHHIIRESVFTDLIVMGEKCSYPPVHHDYDTMHSLYHSSSRPIILTDTNSREIERVVIAMDGTAPASRMLYTYMQLNPFPKAKVVLTYSLAEKEEYQLDGFFERIAKSLSEHGIDVITRPYQEDLGEEAPEILQEEDAQLLALGAHREHFLERIINPFNLRESLAHKLLRTSKASLFIVN